MDIALLKYPIGRFEKPQSIGREEITRYREAIRQLPAKLSQEVAGLSEEQLNTPYRPGGWTVRQVVHHLADSHINVFIRFKLALTEEIPVIKPYYEERWAALADTATMPIAASLQLLAGTHARWDYLLDSLAPADLEKTFVHPEHGKHFSLAETLGMYAWHGEHHLAHIRGTKAQTA